MIGEKISAEEFKAMKARFDAHKFGTTESVVFSHDVIQEMLERPGVTGLRIHFAMTEDERLTVALTAEKASDPGTKSKAAIDDNPPTDRGQLCPPSLLTWLCLLP